MFFAGWALWMLVHAWVLSAYGLSWKLSAIDSLVSNALLLGCSWLISNSLRYYLPDNNRYSYLLALTGLVALFWMLLSKLVLFMLPDSLSNYAFVPGKTYPIRMAVGVLILGTNTLIHVLWYTVQQQQEEEDRRKEAEALSREVELMKLRDQLHPHFLFNSLNSINALIVAKPTQARTMIQQLADFLRGTLRKEENTWNALADEISHLQLYLDIEKVRFGHRLNTVIDIPEALSTAQIPAMLLQPAVENAIKFGLYDTTEPITIDIIARQEGSKLVLEIRNPYDPQTSRQPAGTGFGLRSIQRRLQLLFGQSDLLKTSGSNGLFITTIIVPQPL